LLAGAACWTGQLSCIQATFVVSIMPPNDLVNLYPAAIQNFYGNLFNNNPNICRILISRLIFHLSYLSAEWAFRQCCARNNTIFSARPMKLSTSAVHFDPSIKFRINLAQLQLSRHRHPFLLSPPFSSKQDQLWVIRSLRLFCQGSIALYRRVRFSFFPTAHLPDVNELNALWYLLAQLTTSPKIHFSSKKNVLKRFFAAFRVSFIVTDNPARQVKAATDFSRMLYWTIFSKRRSNDCLPKTFSKSSMSGWTGFLDAWRSYFGSVYSKISLLKSPPIIALKHIRPAVITAAYLVGNKL